MICWAVCANAQGIITDGLLWSENDFAGTARTMGMGNAVTAVGGDIGSIGINPAGSAVATYSQVEITPGASISMTSTTGDGQSFQNTVGQSTGKFIFPNAGLTIKFDTGNSEGLTRFTMGFAANGTNFYNCGIRGSGTNDRSSFAAYLANYATRSGFTPEDLEKYNVDYCCAAGYNSGVIGRLEDYQGNYYVGTTENFNGDTEEIYLGGPVRQSDRHQVSGTKFDYVINFGFDIADIVYLGANLGITNVSYKVQDAITEQASDSYDFQTGLKDYTYNYSYYSAGSGVYGKFGILVTPFSGFRIGAAIQTPTGMKIVENVQHSMSHSYLDGKTMATSPSSSWGYRLESPMRFNVGVAYTINDFALFSIDYERANYSFMRFHPENAEDQIYFDDINDQIQGISGSGDFRLNASDMIRAGVEVKPFPELAVRAGYNFIGSGFQGSGNTQSFSLGIGYISSGSFFCDLAARLAFQPDHKMKIYDDYSVSDEYGRDIVIAGPSTTSTRKLLNITGTLGWRF